jgi:hypothetical protein
MNERELEQVIEKLKKNSYQHASAEDVKFLIGEIERLKINRVIEENKDPSRPYAPGLRG